MPRKRPWSAPCAYSDALPVLYCVTLCIWCLRHALPRQNARLFFGMFTCKGGTHCVREFNHSNICAAMLLWTETFCPSYHLPLGSASKDNENYVKLALLMVFARPALPPACTPCSSLVPASSICTVLHN